MALSDRTNARWVTMVLLALIVTIVALVGFGYAEATRDPVVRTATIVSGEFTSAQPLRLLLLSDAHVQGPDMPPARLDRIVKQANSLRPDVVVLAGDFTGNSALQTADYSVADALRPLKALRAQRGVFAVLGNHDRAHAGAVKAGLASAGIEVIQNKAVQVGPIGLFGVATSFGPKTVHRMLRLHGTRIMVSHFPDGFAVAPSGVSLMIAGHTHCGQIVLPVVGALFTGSRFGSRYRCGLIKEGGKVLVVTAGLGTSNVPLRFGAPPDMWLLTIQGQ